MMRPIVLVSLVAAACAGGAPSPAHPTVPAPAPAAAAGPPAQTAAPPQPERKPPSDEEIVKLSHDLLDAYDRGDVAALEAGFAPELLHFEGGKPTDRTEELEVVRTRKPGAPTIAKRTWEKENVRAMADSAVFVGKATEQQGGNETKGGYKYVGWYLLEWVRKGDAWKARLWTWQRAGVASERESWNEIFRNGLGFTRQPNRLLVEVVKGKQPGAALDVAMGQGRNALHLAAQGWKVTGVDISDEGIRMAREEAARRKLALEAVNANLAEYDFGKSRWDLVTMIYAGNDTARIEKIKPSLRPGGLFVVEYFANDGSTVTDGFSPGQLAKLFATGFEILRDEVVEDVPDWAMDRAKLVRFVAKKR
ncbi:MAG TPA: methyltransferase domain-containing protein [Kofleriaceae bacterium]|nr:methyltransferase domain-containing protein [Kofleriaceae bacterium]